MEHLRQNRRDFIRNAALLAPGLLFLGQPFLLNAAPLGHSEKEEEEVSAVEDLMRENGGLNRILLIYEESMRRLEDKKDFDPQALSQAANLIRRFIEGYHEK